MYAVFHQTEDRYAEWQMPGAPRSILVFPESKTAQEFRDQVARSADENWDVQAIDEQELLRWCGKAGGYYLQRTPGNFEFVVLSAERMN